MITDELARQEVVRLLRRPFTPALYKQIRREWIAHSIAEDNRDIPGLMATLAPDCVYEIVGTDYVWQGHDGATRFYTGLLTAFPDVHFDLQGIVIGPQGVWEEAHVTGTHVEDWLDYPATGQGVEFDVLIQFPWNLEAQKFAGERIHVLGLDAALRARA